MKSQMKSADRSGARFAVIVGARELEQGTATVKDLTSGEETSVPLGELTTHVRKAVAP